MKVIIVFLVLFLAIGLCAASPLDDDDDDLGGDDGHTRVDTSSTVSVNGQTLSRHYHYEGGGDVDYSSVSNVLVTYNEETGSTAFNYFIERQDNCQGNEDASVTIVHQGRESNLHHIKLINFTCSQSSSNPSIQIIPNDNQIQCTATTIDGGSRIDCHYQS